MNYVIMLVISLAKDREPRVLARDRVSEILIRL